MKRLLLLGVLALTAAWSVGGSPAAADQQTIVFLHNAWFERHKNGEAHQQFGVYDFAGIRDALGRNAQVIAPERDPNAQPHAEALEVVELIESLMDDGMEASDIKIVGASKGAFIAQLASEQIAEPTLRWVLVGGCHVRRLASGPAPKMSGRVLSIYDTSDQMAGPCRDFPALTEETVRFEERSVETGRGHGFQFSADEAWIAPARDW